MTTLMSLQEIKKIGLDYETFAAESQKSLVMNVPRGGEEMAEHINLNNRRMDRIGRKTELNQELVEFLGKMQKSQTWVLLAEPWCGDVSQNLPIINRLAAFSDKIDLQIVYRDDHLDLMDRYLTNGARAIPKMIVFEDETEKEIASWGPRPQAAQQIVVDWKKAGGNNKPEMLANVQKWYAKDKGQTLQAELLELVQKTEK